MELHDLFIVCQEYKVLLSAIHEGYQLSTDEAELMNHYEEEFGLEETPADINQEEG